MSISILILALNEKLNLPACMGSVSWSDDVVVLDSYSTDRTVEIAEKAGARVFRRSFDDFARQRNYALDNIDFKHPWVFHLDADERFTDELRRECVTAVAEDKCSGFMVPSKTIFLGRWLRWAATYPVYQMRLMKVGEVRFVQKGHGQREHRALRGISSLREPYLHSPFSKGLAEWFERHRRYAKQEATESMRESRRSTLDLAGLVSLSDPVRSRRALKNLSFRLPWRPFLRFVYMYFLGMGFLDGWPGFRYCRLMAWYERMIVEELKELRRRKKDGSA